MDQQLNMSSKIPLFNGEDYVFWRIRMKSYLISIGLEVCTLVEKGYDVPKSTPIEAEDRKTFWEHENTLNTLQVGLSKKILSNVLNYNNEKQLWDTLEAIYVRDTKVKRAKLQTLKVQYEGQTPDSQGTI
jgi:hypothetical protein